ncbi:helix-turn-helix transcriptional regulator [Sporosarcina sp. GW1-11]|uniref:helix-turn-helix domain-containing protein n=1 Tax=Sporosarcina sp. GW1-11 TaxID=2899126 RepID=UPI00294E3691|nr:helix-turn-helix transcriptional regulator [Sporosarcina sp. GW1-11]MDV6378090.1 helix-turn-helix transcriptional regulator [Sporosarcina sp. GW1-11]
MNEWSKEDFGLRLKELRERRGLSMMAFGAAIGTSASRIKDWERGKNAPSAAWIAKISERFSVSTDELIMGEVTFTPYIKTTGNTVESLYDRLRETMNAESSQSSDGAEVFYKEIDAVNKEQYRSGKGRRLAEKELMELVIRLPKKDVLELLELAKYKRRNL